MPTSQIAIRVDRDQLAALDRLIDAGEFENRADAVRLGLVAVIRAAESRRIDAAIIAGYEQQPATSLEDSATLAALREAIEEEPW